MIAYSEEAAPPLSYDTKALLAVGMACAGLHVAQAGTAVARLMTQRGMSYSGFWAPYYVAEAALRTVLPALLVAGAVGVWTRRPRAARRTACTAAALVALGVVESSVSLVSFFTGPPRPDDLPGVLLAIGRTALNRYGVLVLLGYILLRPRPVPDRMLVTSS